MVISEALGQSIWSRARWLIIAPHPDDETLGAGALIAETAAAGRLSGIIYLTDGTGSHPEGTPGIASARRREAGTAIRRLAKSACVDWIGWKDAHPHDQTDPAFARSARRLGALIRHRAIDAIAVTGPEEAHCDHRAAFQLAKTAAAEARRSVAIFSYHVWSEVPLMGRRLSTARMVAGVRRHALRAHRSQLSTAYGKGFRLAAEQLRMPAYDILVLRRPR